jgi:hypothetical protein
MKAADIDKLLNQVGELASRAEKLATEATSQKRSPPAVAESAAAKEPPAPSPSDDSEKSAELPEPPSDPVSVTASTEPQQTQEQETDLISQEEIDKLDAIMDEQAGKLAASAENPAPEPGAESNQ